MTNDLKPRQPKGIPIGGEFAAYKHNEPGFALNVARHRQSMAERRELLRSNGFVPASTLSAVAAPSTTAHRAEWWDTNMVAAEYRTPGKGYPQMPDDFTPARTGGQAMSGHRRTHRMNYVNSNISVRMPSATAIKRYSQENGNPTFDVPVSVAVAGGQPRQGWVRVTKTGPDHWEATALGGSSAAADQLSEAVASVLEARRPSTALSRVADLLEKKRQRELAKGAEMAPVTSHFIDEVGYDEASGTMATRIGNKLYGHQVSKAMFEAVKDSPRPGTVFNQKIKTNPGAHVDRCGKCARFYSVAVAHVCPTSHKPEAGIGLDYVEKAKHRAEQVAARASHGVDPALARNVVPAAAPVNPAPSVHAQPKPSSKVLPGRSMAEAAFSGLGAQAAVPAPQQSRSQAEAAFSGLGAQQQAPAHLRTPVRNQRDFDTELYALKTSARGQDYDVMANGIEARAEVSCSTSDYHAWVGVGRDGSLQRFLNGEPVAAFEPRHRKAVDMEGWAARNALGMARITDAEEFKRSLRAAKR